MPRLPAFRQGFSTYAARIAIAFLTVPAIGLLKWLASPYLHVHNSLIVFIPAVMFATWFGGLWPGLAAMVLVAFVGESEVPGPAALFAAENHELIRVLLFLITGTQIAIGTEILHRRTREARAASAAKDYFLSILSHELRTPLTPALAAAADLAGDSALPDAIRDQASIIQRNILLEVRLIDDLLDIARIQKGKLQLKREIVDVERTLRETLHTCAHAIAAKNLAIHFHAAPAPCHVNADPARLQQIFWNLLRNAIKFTPDRGSISINLAESAPHSPAASVLVQITDTGAGIPRQHLHAIFNPFHQGDADTPQRFGGLGLGLAITRTLVQLHGGTLSAASDGPGKGATFVVRLPLSEFLPAANPLPQPAPRAKPLRILYVEDHPDTLAVMTRLLQKLGHTVIPASTLTDALRLARQHPVDLLLSDLSLPDGSGAQLLARLRSTHPHLPAIALSGHGSPDDLRRSKAAGFSDHLTKPLDIPELQRTLASLATTSALPNATALL